MKKLSAAYHVNLQDEWLAQMSKNMVKAISGL